MPICILLRIGIYKDFWRGRLFYLIEFETLRSVCSIMLLLLFRQPEVAAGGWGGNQENFTRGSSAQMSSPFLFYNYTTVRIAST